MNQDVKKLDDLVRHIQGVQSNCLLLGKRLIENGDLELARTLIANSMLHDASKFRGIEWDFLGKSNVGGDMLVEAVRQHNRTNPHHPEYWGEHGGIHKMPLVYVGEMVCDWKQRSNEFGTSLVDYINFKATVRFGFTKDDIVYSIIFSYVNMLLDTPFK